MPARLVSLTRSLATTWLPSGLSPIEAPSRSSDGRFLPDLVFGHVASPAVAARLFSGIVMLAAAWLASSTGPTVSLAKWVNGPVLLASVRLGAARKLLLSLETTPRRPGES